MTAQQTSSPKASIREDILRFLLKRGTATAGAIASHLQITPQAVRRHLKTLEASNLIEHQVSHASIGRPNHLYQLSRQGREHFPDRYDQFALSFLDTVADTLGPEQVSRLLKHQWQSKAKEYREHLGNASLKDRMQMLVKLRQAEGYMAEYYPVQTADIQTPTKGTEAQETEAQKVEERGIEGKEVGEKEVEKIDAGAVEAEEMAEDAFVITEYNCAIAQIAESYPTICGHELAMFAVALPDCSVERTHWLVDGEHQCGYLIKTKKK